jgi:hypothetical protein
MRGFQGGQASYAFKTPTCAPSTRFEQNEFVLYQFQGIMFPYMLLLGATMVALVWFWFPSLQRSLITLP